MIKKILLLAIGFAIFNADGRSIIQEENDTYNSYLSEYKQKITDKEREITNKSDTFRKEQLSKHISEKRKKQKADEILKLKTEKHTLLYQFLDRIINVAQVIELAVGGNITPREAEITQRIIKSLQEHVLGFVSEEMKSIKPFEEQYNKIYEEHVKLKQTIDDIRTELMHNTESL